MTTIRLLPFTQELVSAIQAGDRQADWAEGYPTAGDVEVAGRIADGTWTTTSDDAPWGPWAVSEIDGGHVVGGAGFHGVPGADGSVEIGYGIAAEWQGRGIATAAVGLLVELAIAGGAWRVVAATDEDNVASQRVLVANGFASLGLLDGEIRWMRDLLPESPA